MEDSFAWQSLGAAGEDSFTADEEVLALVSSVKQSSTTAEYQRHFPCTLR